MPLFFSHSYIIPKLFCIKLFRLDLLLIRFSLTPCCCPTLCISQRCHHSELLNCALWWLEPAMPNMGQSWPLLIEAFLQPSQPAPGRGHPAQWCRDSKEPEDSSRLAGDSSSDFYSHEGKFTCGDWAVPCKLWWISDHAGPAPHTHTATSTHSYYGLPTKAECLYFTALSLCRVSHIYCGLLHFVPRMLSLVRRQ